MINEHEKDLAKESCKLLEELEVAINESDKSDLPRARPSSPKFNTAGQRIINEQRFKKGKLERIHLEIGTARRIELPFSMVKIVKNILTKIAEGKEVQVIEAVEEVSTQKAADILNVSRPYLIKILEEGEIEYRRVGNRRRVSLNSLIKYKNVENEKRHRVLDELTKQAQELGMGY